MTRRETGFGAHMRQLRGDMINVAWKSGLVAFVLSSIPTDPMNTKGLLTKMAVSGASGFVDYLFRGLKPDHDAPVSNKDEEGHWVESEPSNLPDIIESMLVAANPIAIFETLNSLLPVSTKAIALTGLALVNASMLFAGRRLGEMEELGHGKDLEG
ncbi:hypothetical protein M1328_02115 [Patescibacteria group bacterium]|nr:hypothetical protein [Patescibacteria group bacterium]